MIRLVVLCVALGGCGYTMVPTSSITVAPSATTATASVPVAATAPAAMPATIAVPQIVVVFCATDQVIQPLAVELASVIPQPAVQAAVQTDNLLVHPAVQSACAAINGKPASVLPVQAAAPKS